MTQVKGNVMIKRYGEIACDIDHVKVVSANGDKSTVLLVVPTTNSLEQVLIDCSLIAANALLAAVDQNKIGFHTCQTAQ